MQINERGLALIKEFEGCRLDAYLCPAGVPTIGYGITKGVKLGQHISQGEADEMLLEEVENFALGVEKLIGTAKTSENQFSAMVALAYNIGLGAFGGSTVLKRHKIGNPVGAANAFLMWTKGGGKILPGLMRRREAERKLYLA